MDSKGDLARHVGQLDLITHNGNHKTEAPTRRLEDKNVSKISDGVFKFADQKQSMLLLSDDDLRCPTPQKKENRKS